MTWLRRLLCLAGLHRWSGWWLYGYWDYRDWQQAAVYRRCYDCGQWEWRG